MRFEMLIAMLAGVLASGMVLAQGKGGPPSAAPKGSPMSSPPPSGTPAPVTSAPPPSSIPISAPSLAPSAAASTSMPGSTASSSAAPATGAGTQIGDQAPRLDSTSGLPSAPAGAGAPRDPVTRELGVALRHTSNLRRELTEGRAEGSRAAQLIQEIGEALLGARKASNAKDQPGNDEAWETPRAQAQRLLEDVGRGRQELIHLPESSKAQATRQVLENVGAMQSKIVEASRKRHQIAQSSVRNAR